MLPGQRPVLHLRLLEWHRQYLRRVEQRTRIRFLHGMVRLGQLADRLSHWRKSLRRAAPPGGGERQSAVCSYSLFALGPDGQTMVVGILVCGVEPRPTVRPPMTFGPPNFGVERHLKNLRYAITSLAPHGPVVWRLERVPSGSPGQMTGTSTWRPNSASIVPMTSPSVAYECTASMRAGMRLTSGSAASARTRSNDASTVAWSRS
jgi:hypothetical protein